MTTENKRMPEAEGPHEAILESMCERFPVFADLMDDCPNYVEDLRLKWVIEGFEEMLNFVIQTSYVTGYKDGESDAGIHAHQLETNGVPIDSPVVGSNKTRTVTGHRLEQVIISGRRGWVGKIHDDHLVWFYPQVGWHTGKPNGWWIAISATSSNFVSEGDVLSTGQNGHCHGLARTVEQAKATLVERMKE